MDQEVWHGQPSSHLERVSRGATAFPRAVLRSNPNAEHTMHVPNLTPDDRNAIHVAQTAGAQRIEELAGRIQEAAPLHITQPPAHLAREQAPGRMAGVHGANYDRPIPHSVDRTYQPAVPQHEEPTGSLRERITHGVGGWLGRNVYNLGIEAVAHVYQPFAAVDRYLNGRAMAVSDPTVPGDFHNLHSREISRAFAERLMPYMLSHEGPMQDIIFTIAGLPEGAQKAWHEVRQHYHEWRASRNEARWTALVNTEQFPISHDLQEILREYLNTRPGTREPIPEGTQNPYQHTPEYEAAQRIIDRNPFAQDRQAGARYVDRLERLFDHEILHALTNGDRGTLEQALQRYQRTEQTTGQRLDRLAVRSRRNSAQAERQAQASEALNREIIDRNPAGLAPQPATP